MRILVIEDEKLLSDSICKILRKKGFDVEAVYDGEEGALYAETGIYDLLILDVMIPKIDGFEVLRKVRAKRCATPILMLSARSSVDDRVLGLNLGADYYLSKPFDIRELLACINAMLRRQGTQLNELSFGNTTLDLDTCMLEAEGQTIRLTAKEFDVMRYLLSAGEQIVPKESILARAWGLDSSATDNHVEVYIGFLRKKLFKIGSNIKITSLKRLGYHLEVDSDAQKTEA